MSTRLKLSNALAGGVFNTLRELLTDIPTSLDSAIIRSRSIVKLWSSAELDLLDEAIMPFRAIESQLDGVEKDSYDIAVVSKETLDLFAKSSEEMLSYIKTIVELR